jgi:hypothetical protein
MKKKVLTKPLELGKDGKEISSEDLKEIAAAYGKTEKDVKDLIHNTWGDRRTDADINFAHVIFHSLEQIKQGRYSEIRRRRVPANETDLHLAIHMNEERLKQLWKDKNLGKSLPKDFIKSASQTYTRIMESVGSYVKAMSAKSPK